MPESRKPTPHAKQAPPEAAAHAEGLASFGLDRVVFFSDAVIAIAITLLVLDIRLPDAGPGAPPGLATRLLALWPKYLGFLVSFWVIALYWVAHHRCFRYIRRYNRRLITLNFLFLLFIASMPFPTSLLFSNSPETASVALYAGTACGMGLSLAALWIYAVRRGFIAADVSRPVVADVRLNLILPPLVFFFSTALAFVSVNVAMAIWFLLLPIYLFRRRTERLLLED